MSKKVKVWVGDRWYAVEIADLDANPVQALVDGELVEVRVDELRAPPASEPAATPSPTSPTVSPSEEVSVPEAPKAARVLRSPMPGIIVSLAVEEDDQVVTGDEICVLEAMKMHQTLRADWSGVVVAVHVAPGQQIQDGAPIVELA
jgi:biotin carboxyl carrier protein